jgi:hypothetical protein
VEVASRSNSFRPESYWHICILHHASCLGVECPNHSLGNTILVLSVWWCRFVRDSVFPQYSQEPRIVVFTGSIVASKPFDPEATCAHPCLICLKLGGNFLCRFCDEEVYLGVACVVVDVNDVELSPSDTVFYGSTEIRMY